MELNKRVIDEKQLIDACVQGKAWAQKKIYEQYSSVMMGICVRYVTDKETARDLLQDGFIKVFTKIGMYNSTGSFEGWMRRVFVTTALEYLRQNNALKQSSSIDEYQHTIQDADATILEKISANDLLDCISKLPHGYRTVFNLYVIEGYSHLEIGELLNISENTSRSQFMRARKLLQKAVQSL